MAEHEHSHGADAEASCRCSGPSSELVRFSVTAPDDLLRRFDEQIARRGDVANRSEAVRDLIRASIAKEQMRTPDEQVIGSLTMIYDHHTGDLTRRLDEVQHDYTDEIVSTTLQSQTGVPAGNVAGGHFSSFGLIFAVTA